jgi:steroid 5-alpha reductase family enzyme
MTTTVDNNKFGFIEVDQVLDALVTGTDWQALGALALVSIVTLIPLTLIRNSYCFSVGYGAAVATMALTLLLAFFGDGVVTTNEAPALLLAWTTAIYGIRLSTFLLLREFTVPGMKKQVEKFAKHSKVKVVPLAVVLAVFYAFMVCPVLFVLRRDTGSLILPYAGAMLAVAGLVIEAVADFQKYWYKRQKGAAYDQKEFAGPTQGLLYGLCCRHPNFFGEVVFWTGILLGGITAKSTTGQICGLLGWFGICSIMRNSAKHMDAKQEKLYGGQPEFEEWKKRVNSSLFPRFPGKSQSTTKKSE